MQLYLAGIILYVVWFLLAIMKVSMQPQNRRFSYRRAFFGTKDWFTNFRNLLLLVSLYMIFIYAPLRVIFLMLILSFAIVLLLAVRNFFSRVANPYVDLALMLSSAVLLAGSIFVTIRL